jgi:hypothetical protein
MAIMVDMISPEAMGKALKSAHQIIPITTPVVNPARIAWM